MFDEIFGSEDFGNGAMDGAAVGPVTQVHTDKDFCQAKHPLLPARSRVVGQ